MVIFLNHISSNVHGSYYKYAFLSFSLFFNLKEAIGYIADTLEAMWQDADENMLVRVIWQAFDVKYVLV